MIVRAGRCFRRHAGQSLLRPFVCAFLSLAGGMAVAADPDGALDDGDDAQLAVAVSSSQNRSAANAGAEKKTDAPLSRLADPALSTPDLEWAIPPIPWRAKLDVSHDRQKSGQGPWSSATATALSARASSYVLAPWFLGLGATSSLTKTSNATGVESQAASGSVSGSLLSRSRYPASFGLGAGSSSTSGPGGSNAGYKSFNWAQQYSPEDALFTSGLNYNWSAFGVSPGSTTTSQALSSSVTFRVPGEIPQSLSASAAMTTTSTDASAAGSKDQKINVNHGIYLEDYVMTINSDGAYSRLLSKGEQTSESLFYSAGSQMDWVPSDDLPLRVQATARHHNLRNVPATGGSGSQIESTSLFMTGNYAASKNWAFSGNTQVVDSRSSDFQTTVYNTAISAGWSGDGLTRKFDLWDYSLSYRSSLGASHLMTKSSQAESVSAVNGAWGGGVDHQARRSFTADPKDGAASVVVSQGLSGSKTAGGASDPMTVSLNHGVVYFWNRAPQQDSTLTAAVSATDGRSFGASRSQYQSISSSLAGGRQFNPREALSWNAALPLSRQGGEGGYGAWRGSVNAGASYSHARFANVTGLGYAANYSMAVRPRDDFAVQGRSGLAVDQSFGQSWSWRLGLLAWKADNQINRSSEGAMSMSIRLSISRDFGGVL